MTNVIVIYIHKYNIWDGKPNLLKQDETKVEGLYTSVKWI